jgi:hypothetical protein
MLESYRNAFESCYPQHRLELKRGKMKNGGTGYWVVIDGEKGDRPLSTEEILDAINMFTR